MTDPHPGRTGTGANMHRSGSPLGAEGRRRIGALALAAYPEEACGVWCAPPARGTDRGTGAGGVVVVPCRNAAPIDRGRRFAIDPDELRTILRGRGDRWVGVFHSHPDGTTDPSAIDQVEALPGLLAAIVAVEADGEKAFAVYERGPGPGAPLRAVGAAGLPEDVPTSRIRPASLGASP